MNKCDKATLAIDVIKSYLFDLKEVDKSSNKNNTDIRHDIQALTYAIELLSEYQNDAKDTNVPTIGDKIRESNESLAAYASEFFDCDCCKIINPTCMYKYSECEKLMLVYFNKPAGSEEE